MLRIRPVLVSLTTSAALLAAPAAHAFGGTAPNLGHQGNFVVSNRANLGVTQTLTSPGTTDVALAPELDYFVAPNWSIGGAVVLDFHTTSGAPSNTAFGVVPQAGYHVVLSDTWSLWPRLAVTLMTGAPAHVSVELSAPFLVHPAEHFFFGFGPAVSTDVTGDNKVTAVFGTFLVGGYFDS